MFESVRRFLLALFQIAALEQNQRMVIKHIGRRRPSILDWKENQEQKKQKRSGYGLDKPFEEPVPTPAPPAIAHPSFRSIIVSRVVVSFGTPVDLSKSA